MTGTKLAKYDAMVKAIAVAYKVDEVKAIRDQAAALEKYAKLAKDTENERRCCEIRLRAERKAGQILKKMPKAKGARDKRATRSSGTTAPTLKKRGITKDQSSQWQKLAKPTDQQFEAALDQAEMPTTAGIIKATEPPKETPVAPEALWLWGRLKDFQRDGLLDREPADVLATMTPAMLNDVHSLAPRVAAWLKRIGATNAKGQGQEAEDERQERSGGSDGDSDQDNRHAA
jgi:hypothetical protein